MNLLLRNGKILCFDTGNEAGRAGERLADEAGEIALQARIDSTFAAVADEGDPGGPWAVLTSAPEDKRPHYSPRFFSFS